MNTTKNIRDSRFFRRLGIFAWGILAFLALCFEALPACIEQSIYGVDINNFSSWQTILHWVFTYIIWGASAYFIVRGAKKKGYELFAANDKRSAVWQWVCIVIGVAACLISTWIDWNGSKVLAEFTKRGPLLFVFQYIYYLFEVFLVMLIIVCGQKACEIWSGIENIPFGGIIAALTWGLGHWASKGSLTAGIVSAVCGLALGSVYLLTNRKAKLSYILLCVMFIL